MLKQIVTILTITLISTTAFSQQGITWTIQDKMFNVGDTVKADFNISDFNNIVAYQFAMKFDTSVFTFLGVEFAPNNPLQLNSGDFGFYQLPKGLIRHLWSNPYGQSIPTNTYMFSYKFKAKKAGQLSKILTLVKCCINPPLNPMSYYYLLNYQKLYVNYVNTPTGQVQSKRLIKPIEPIEPIKSDSTFIIEVNTQVPVTVKVNGTTVTIKQ